MAALWATVESGGKVW